MSKQLQAQVAFTHGWGDAKSPRRLKMRTGDKVTVGNGPEDLPEAEATELRAKGMLATPIAEPPAVEAEKPAGAPNAPQRPAGLRSKVS